MIMIIGRCTRDDDHSQYFNFSDVPLNTLHKISHNVKKVIVWFVHM